jgi:tetratricopeptide (TPR) repeat protein
MSLFKSQPTAWSAKDEGAGLYHKQQVPPRRRAERIHQLDAGPTPRSAKGRGNPFQQTFMTSIRTFVVVMVAMIIALMLSIKGLRFVWQAKDQKILAGRPARVATAEPVENIRKPPEPPSPHAGVTISTKRGPEQDAQSMRKALLLAKRAEALAASGFEDEAINRYREALSIWPHLSSAWAQLGRLHLQAGDYPRAQAALEKAVGSETGKGSAPVLNDLGVALLYQNRADRAIPIFESANHADPDFAASHFNLALCHLSRNDRPGALASLNKYLALEPDDARALRERAFLDAALTNYPDAMSALTRAIKLTPDWPLLYLDAAAVAALMNDTDQAIAYLRKAEPVSSPATVYRLYQEATFAAVRETEKGKAFSKDLASRVSLQGVSSETGSPTGERAGPMHSSDAASMP